MADGVDELLAADGEGGEGAFVAGGAVVAEVEGEIVAAVVVGGGGGGGGGGDTVTNEM